MACFHLLWSRQFIEWLRRVVNHFPICRSNAGNQSGLLLLLLCLASAFAQTDSDCATQASEPSPDGWQLLEAAIAAGGGRDACSKLMTFRAAGSFSVYSHGEILESGRADLCGNGLAQFRLDADLPTENLAWFVNNGVGLLRTRGAVHRIGRHNLSALEGVVLPLRKILALSAGTSVQVIESTSFGGRAGYRVRITREESSSSRQPETLPHLSVETSVVVDAETFAILAIENTFFPRRDARESYLHRLIYSDYHSVGGVTIPYSIREEISGELTWGLQIVRFEANASVSDHDF